MGETTGDTAADRLFEQSYAELCRLAHARLRRSETITLLDTSVLVHEFYVRFPRSGGSEFADRGAFLGYAARAMRGLTVDFIRQRRAARRGGGVERQSLEMAFEGVDDAAPVENLDTAQARCMEEDRILDLSDAIDRLAGVAPRLAQVVELRYFAGFTEEEIAKCLGVTDRTVRRDWEKARRMLRAALAGST